MGHLTGLVRHPACKFKKEIREIQLATKCQHLEKKIRFLSDCLSVSAKCRRMLNSFWSCSWSLITEKNIIHSKALAKQEEPKQLSACPKNECCFIITKYLQWSRHKFCSFFLGFLGHKKYFITQLKQIIQISEIFLSHCDFMLRACRKGIKVIFKTVLFLEWTLSSKYMTSHLGLKL